MPHQLLLLPVGTAGAGGGPTYGREEAPRSSRPLLTLMMRSSGEEDERGERLGAVGQDGEGRCSGEMSEGPPQILETTIALSSSLHRRRCHYY